MLINLRAATIAALLFLCLTGPAGASEKGDPGKAIPLPWSVQEIRKATQAGTKLKFRAYVKDEDTEATVVKLLEIVSVSDKGLTVRSTQTFPDGKLTSTIRNPRDEEYTWDQWAGGFGFGKMDFNERDTTVSEEKVTVPGGTFLCKVYKTVVIEDEESGDNTTTVWAFVKDRPGLFVKLSSTYTVEDEPPSIQSMELLEATEPR